LLLAAATLSLGYEFWPSHISLPKGPIETFPAKYNPNTDPEFQQAVRMRRSGHLTEAVKAFDQLSRSARLEGNLDREARTMLAKGSCHLRSFEYREAAASYFQVIDLATRVQDSALLGAAYVNVAEIHVQLGDLSAAKREARQAVAILQASGRPDYLTRAEIQLGSIDAADGYPREAIDAYREAIALAQHSANVENESRAWIVLGDTFSAVEDLKGAEWAFLQAYRLGVLHHDPALTITRAKLAELEWKKGNPALGLRRLDAVLRHPGPELSEIPEYQILYRRAQMLAALGRNEEALHDYRLAVTSASRWREGALPGETVNASSVAVVHGIFADASDFAAGLAMERSDERLRRESLETLAVNRAADLREKRTLAWQQDGRLPTEYYKVLEQLRNAEARALLNDGDGQAGAAAKAGRLRADLDLLETRLSAGFGVATGNRERIRLQASLSDVQRNLAENDALFSFSLGKQRSWLWVVTRRHLSLFQLGPGADLERQSAEWAAKVRSSNESSREGLLLSAALFGQIPSSVWRKRNWIIVSDGSLFINVPLAALPALDGEDILTRKPDCPVIPLVEAHTVRFAASEYSLANGAQPAVGEFRFAGFGDPIYNLADSRLKTADLGPRLSEGSRTSQMGAPLARLVGSGQEVRSAAALFPGADVFTGASACTRRVRSVVARPAEIIHFAAHVISPEGHPENAAIALSLGRNRLPELLTPELISTFRVPGSLVVLSGCDSQRGKPVPGVGVQGLSRAWLLAGASAVVASTWPIPDDGGHFFDSFYRHLAVDKRSSAASVPKLAAAALAAAQNEMRNAGGNQQSSSFWAAYTVMSKE
jgi:CHAT domain-containing protein/tetratricopeptide (TPR) repeat protein